MESFVLSRSNRVMIGPGNDASRLPMTASTVNPTMSGEMKLMRDAAAAASIDMRKKRFILCVKLTIIFITDLYCIITPSITVGWHSKKDTTYIVSSLRALYAALSRYARLRSGAAQRNCVALVNERLFFAAL